MGGSGKDIGKTSKTLLPTCGPGSAAPTKTAAGFSKMKNSRTHPRTPELKSAGYQDLHIISMHN